MHKNPSANKDAYSGRVRKVVASPLETIIARRRFSSRSGPRTKPSLLCDQVLDTHARLQTIDRSILAEQRTNEVARRLSTIPASATDDHMGRSTIGIRADDPDVAQTMPTYGKHDDGGLAGPWGCRQSPG